MRRAVVAAAAACLLIAPTVLAFFSGGYFAEPRLIAAVVTWALVLALALVGPAPLPRRLPGRLALAGLVLMTAWSALSISWAPLGGPATDNVERLVLYTGALLLAIGALRARPAQRLVEPALAAGATLVIGYGLAGRLLPGVIQLERSRSAGGRLEQPITYWNAEGALAAIGLVLCVRLAGDRTRRPAVRALAAAAVAPLGAGIYVSFSRGAIAAAVLGLVVLVAGAPSRAQLRAAVIALVTGVAAAVAAAPFPGVASLSGAHAERDGAIVLALLLLIGGAAALATLRGGDSDEPLPAMPWLRPAAAAALGLAILGLVVAGVGEKPTQAELGAGASAGRLTTASSNRYEYWRVGLQAFGDQPLRGVGSGGFRVVWLKERTIPEAVRDVHSIELEMAAELGLVGLAAFALLVGGVAAAGLRGLRTRSALAAGPVAALVVWFLHASIDWDWQLPAVSLPAIALAGALIALDDVSVPAPDPAAGSARAPAPPRPDPPHARTSAADPTR
jgi:O-antigen ligase